MARGVPIPPEYELAPAIGRRIELACLADPLELRPCHNDLLNANFIDDGARIRIVDWEYAGMGTRSSTSATSASTTSLRSTRTGDPAPPMTARSRRGDRLARLTLFRVVSDFREAMWGVLQQGVSTLDFDFRGYAAEHFDRLLANAATPRFEHARPRSATAD